MVVFLFFLKKKDRGTHRSLATKKAELQILEIANQAPPSFF